VTSTSAAALSPTVELDGSGVSYRSLSRTDRLAGLSALAAVVLSMVANTLWAFEQPDPGASAPELVDFYGDLSTRIVIGGS
jgi:hypothetical protein